MTSRPDPYSFDPIQWHEYPFYDADDFLADQAMDHYQYLCEVAAGLEELLDDQQVDYLSDLQLTPEDYRALDAIRNQTTEAPA